MTLLTRWFAPETSHDVSDHGRRMLIVSPQLDWWRRV
jgi:hypothetical protein